LVRLAGEKKQLKKKDVYYLYVFFVAPPPIDRRSMMPDGLHRCRLPIRSAAAW
jgi:hypothetical protein